MKTMTCSQMGGECDAKIMGATEDEMIANAMKHLEAAHPEMAADVKKTSPKDPMMVEWMKKFKKDFAAAPKM